MSLLNYNKQLLIAGFIFTLHNIEEAFGFSRFIFPSQLPIPVHPTSTAMIWAIGLITIVGWGFIFAANTQQSENFRKSLLTIFATVFLVNAIFPHIAGAIFLHRYFPALITSIVLFLPYSLWILPKLYRVYSSPFRFFATASGGLALGGIIIVIVQALAYFASR